MNKPMEAFMPEVTKEWTLHPHRTSVPIGLFLTMATKKAVYSVLGST